MSAVLVMDGWAVPSAEDFKKIFGQIGENIGVNVMKRCACVCTNACACKCNCVCSGSCNPTPTGKCPW